MSSISEIAPPLPPEIIPVEDDDDEPVEEPEEEPDDEPDVEPDEEPVFPIPVSESSNSNGDVP